MVYHKILNIVPCTTYTWALLFIHSVYNSLRLLTLTSQSTPLPPFPRLGKAKSVLCVCESVAVSYIGSFASF